MKNTKGRGRKRSRGKRYEKKRYGGRKKRGDEIRKITTSLYRKMEEKKRGEEKEEQERAELKKEKRRKKLHVETFFSLSFHSSWFPSLLLHRLLSPH